MSGASIGQGSRSQLSIRLAIAHHPSLPVFFRLSFWIGDNHFFFLFPLAQFRKPESLALDAQTEPKDR